MFETLKELNWTLIISLIVLSAFVSYAADRIGQKCGKKKISIGKLRPKYTSRIISALSGMLIAIVTVALLAAASTEVRTAIFSMKFVQREINRLTLDLDKNRRTLDDTKTQLFESNKQLAEKQTDLATLSQEIEKKQKENDEITALNKTLKEQTEKLKGTLGKVRSGKIATFSGEVLAQGTITSGSVNSLNHLIAALKDQARHMISERTGTALSKVPAPNISATSIQSLKGTLAKYPNKRFYARLIAQDNFVSGEALDAKIVFNKSNLIYHEGATLKTLKFAPGTERQRAESIIYSNLKELNRAAASRGVLRDPITGNIGTLDSENLFEVLGKIAENDKETTLLVLAHNDTFTEGPLKIILQVKE